MAERKSCRNSAVTERGSSRLSSSRASKARGARLVITNGCFSGLEIELRGKKTSLGRDIKCDICLDNPLVDGRHAVISRSPDGYYIEDQGSAHGTCVNGKEIQRIKLKNGNVISIGEFSLAFFC